jgi:VCBS repeat-containing protein
LTLFVGAADGVLTNDHDAESDPLTALLVGDVQHGALQLAADGSFRYTPPVGFQGTDSFTYKPNDGAADGTVVTVNLTVHAVNHAPVAQADAYSTSQGVALVVSAASGVRANDADPDGDSLTALLVGGVQHGALQFAADGSFRYTPAVGFRGTDGFTYKPNDGAADGTTASRTSPMTAPPTATPSRSHSPLGRRRRS